LAEDALIVVAAAAFVRYVSPEVVEVMVGEFVLNV
jgi:hypothetical protein